LGIDPISRYSRQFGLGSKTGIALSSERSGLVPSRKWKQKNRGERWYPGETISIAIGQGFLSVTPIQMAKVISIVATNGQVVQPRLLKGVRLRRTGNLKEEPPPSRQQVPISPQTFFQIKEGLTAVVTKGTAKRAQSELVSIAGKTGTAQVIALKDDDDKTEVRKKHRDHAWFVAFAPIEEPKIAVAVIVEHMGHGGSAAAPLAKTLIEAHMNFEKAKDVDSF
jgi:penicillin-binding protein 2